MNLKVEKGTAAGERRAVFGVCLGLVGIVWAVFGQTLHFAFVNFDDPRYVTDNSVVQKGLTWEGFRWALDSFGEIGHWHPVTWLSHMLDCQWYGLNAGGHHFTNVFFHAATVVLLFLVLRRMTGCLWRSALVAAIFAVHPLRAESVAWISERKDVLSGFFFMLTLAAYVRFVRGPFSPMRYGVVILCFALGLLAKNMLVTLPFVLLLLDYWPLGRLMDQQTFSRCVKEKIPLFLLAAASCVVTVLLPEKVSEVDAMPFWLRLENAVTSYIIYLWQMIHPAGLTCLYPIPKWIPLWRVGAALGLLGLISGVAWAARRQYPYLLVGWLWYLGMMVPVIGIVQISFYAHADRYTYLPGIGLVIALVWMLADLRFGGRRQMVGFLSGGVIMALGFCAWTQTAYWRDSGILWRHALACTSDNAIAHNNLGEFLGMRGDLDAAIDQLKQALAIKPRYSQAEFNLGNVLTSAGKVDEAMAHYQAALEIAPDNMKGHNNLGNLYFRKGMLDEAINEFQKALQLDPERAGNHLNLANAYMEKERFDEAIVELNVVLKLEPDNAIAHYNLGDLLRQKGNVDEAVGHFQKALKLNPVLAEAHYGLGAVLLQMGHDGQAMLEFRQTLAAKPDYAEALNDLAWVLATSSQALRDGNEAVTLAMRANELTGGGNAEVLTTLAAAEAEAGRFDEAISTARHALALAQAAGQTQQAGEVEGQLMLYEQKQAFHRGDGKQGK